MKVDVRFTEARAPSAVQRFISELRCERSKKGSVSVYAFTDTYPPAVYVGWAGMSKFREVLLVHDANEVISDLEIASATEAALAALRCEWVDFRITECALCVLATAG